MASIENTKRRRSLVAQNRRNSILIDSTMSPHAVAAFIPEDLPPEKRDAQLFLLCLKQGLKALSKNHNEDTDQDAVAEVCQKTNQLLKLDDRLGEQDLLRELEKRSNTSLGDAMFEHQKQLYEERQRWKQLRVQSNEKLKEIFAKVDGARKNPLDLPPIAGSKYEVYADPVDHQLCFGAISEILGGLRNTADELDAFSKDCEDTKDALVRTTQGCIDHLVDNVLNEVRDPFELIESFLESS